jgi:long-chain acyl-CoA synthetase
VNRPWLKYYDLGVSPDLKIPSIPLHQILIDSARVYPRNPAIAFYGKTLSYTELNDLTNQFGNVLKSFGVLPGDRVAIMLPNTPQCVIAYFGILKIGAIAVQTNPLYVERELEHQIIDSNSEIIVALDLFYPKIMAIKENTTLRQVILCHISDFLPTLLKWIYLLKGWKERYMIKFEKKPFINDSMDLVQGASPELEAPEVKPEYIALLQYTAGTTGTAKGVMLTHYNMVANIVQCRSWMPDLKAGQESFVAVIPFFHVYGMTGCMNLAIYLGGKLILMPRFKTKEVLNKIEKHKATVFQGIQAMYVAINHFPGIKKKTLSSIKICVSGGGPLHVSVQEAFESLTGGKLVEGYGLTEASPVTHCNPIYGIRKKGAIGLPLPLTEARIVDLEQGEKDMPAGEPGELIVKGPQVMKGYWKQPDETDVTIRDGWLYTGDIAKMDDDGFFYILDRKKDMIKTSGENVYPSEVEGVLFQYSKIEDVVVVGVPDEFSVEIIKAYIILKKGERVTEEEILNHCRKYLAKFKVPKLIEFRTEFPRTIVGKVLRRFLLEEELKGKQGKMSDKGL